MNLQQATKQYLKDIRSLAYREVREQKRQIIIEGERSILDALDSEWQIQSMLVSDMYLAKNPACKDWLPEDTIRVTTELELQKVSQLDTAPGVLAVLSIPKLGPIDFSKQNILCYCDMVSNPTNLGSIIRTADWFGIETVLLASGSVDHFNAKAVQASMGSLFHVRIEVLEDPITELTNLQRQGFQLIACDAHKGTAAVPSKKKKCLMLGNEAHGLRPEIWKLNPDIYQIPRKGKAESLNVATSFAIAAYVFSK